MVYRNISSSMVLFSKKKVTCKDTKNIQDLIISCLRTGYVWKEQWIPEDWMIKKMSKYIKNILPWTLPWEGHRKRIKCLQLQWQNGDGHRHLYWFLFCQYLFPSVRSSDCYSLTPLMENLMRPLVNRYWILSLSPSNYKAQQFFSPNLLLIF